jgi:arginase family enzyme
MRHTGNRIGGSNPSLSANFNQLDAAAERAMALGAFPVSFGAEHSSVAPIAI